MGFDAQRVLVTGGAGFIGSQVTRTLLERGADVHVIDNLFAGRQALVPEAASFTELDIRSEELDHVVRSHAPDMIVHLAALHYVPYCDEHPGKAFDVNVMGTRNLLTAAANVDQVERVIYTSSAAVYPPREEPNTETSSTGPIDIYGKTKLVGEDLLQAFTEQTGKTGVTARVFNVYGPNETNPHVIPAILNQLENGTREIELGNLTPKRDFIHVRDVTRALVTLLAEFDDQYAVFNVGAGNPYSIREVVDCVREALGEDVRVVQDESRVRESDRPNLEADISRMEAEFGWEPQTDFVNGIRELLVDEVV